VRDTRPLAIDLFCGLGGWTKGLLAEGWDVVGFDIERHVYGEHRYPAQLVLQDVLSLDGAQFRHADLIVASPPCQEYSYMAMPWTRAKQIARALRGMGEFPEGYTGSRTPAELTALFDACFRIRREASIERGRTIPLVVENVCGAQRWVGRAQWHYGSYYLWGDVPALMPVTFKAHKVPGFRFDGSGGSFQTASVENGVKVGGLDCSNRDRKGQAFNTHAERATKNAGGSWFNVAHNTTSGHGQNPDGRLKAAFGVDEAVKCGGDWFGKGESSPMRMVSSKSTARKAASARIAKIPFALSRHIASVYHPDNNRSAA